MNDALDQERSFTIRDMSATADGREWDAYVAASPHGNHCYLSALSQVIEVTFGHKAHYLLAERPDGSAASCR